MNERMNERMNKDENDKWRFDWRDKGIKKMLNEYKDE